MQNALQGNQGATEARGKATGAFTGIRLVSLSWGFLGFTLIVASARPATASEPVTITEDRDARQPQLAIDGRGRVFVAFGKGRSIRCATSTDGGRTFGEALTVAEVPTLALGMRRGPRIAATEDAVVITAVVGEKGGGHDGDLLAWRSTDLGQTWTGPTRINSQETSAREGLHAMAAGPDKRIFCAWLDDRNGRKEVFGARSLDGGASWEPDALIYRSPDKTVCECCHPSVAIGPDGKVFVMWRNSLKGARDFYFCRSDDGGATFGPAAKLGRGTWPLDACPMDGGALAVGPRGAVETAWRRAETVYRAAPGQVEQALAPGQQPWIAAGPKGSYIVWLAKRPGLLQVAEPGALEPRLLAKSANDPVVAAAIGGRGPVVAAWETGEGIAAQVLAPGDQE